MKQIITIMDGEQFIFNEVSENKWIETYGKRYEDEDGDIEWSIVHTVRYLTEEDVNGLVRKLAEVGFERV